jgi:hypothetical protein
MRWYFVFVLLIACISISAQDLNEVIIGKWEVTYYKMRDTIYKLPPTYYVFDKDHWKVLVKSDVQITEKVDENGYQVMDGEKLTYFIGHTRGDQYIILWDNNTPVLMGKSKISGNELELINDEDKSISFHMKLRKIE